MSLEQTADVAGAKLATDYAAFGLSKDMGAMAATLAGDFHAKMNSAKSQRDLALQATSAKDASRAALEAGLAQISAVLYAPQSGVTDAQLASIGFAPRRGGSVRPKIAQRVTDLVALPNGIDAVTLRFARAGNPASTTFQVFASGDQEATWTMVATSNRTRITVPLAPGTPQSYRIVAQASGVASAPSLPVSIYGPAPEASLRLVEGGKAA